MSAARRLLVPAAFGLCLFLALDAGAQSAAPPEPAPAAPETERPGLSLSEVNDLNQNEEELAVREGVKYDPGDRRDPFKSLLVSTLAEDEEKPRPEGVPGLLIDEILITGIIKTPQGFVAQVQSAVKEKSFLIKQGDQLYDGDVIRIEANEIVFKQRVEDPTALKPFKEVVKSLRPGGS